MWWCTKGKTTKIVSFCLILLKALYDSWRKDLLSNIAYKFAMVHELKLQLDHSNNCLSDYSLVDQKNIEKNKCMRVCIKCNTIAWRSQCINFMSNKPNSCPLPQWQWKFWEGNCSDIFGVNVMFSITIAKKYLWPVDFLHVHQLQRSNTEVWRALISCSAGYPRIHLSLAKLLHECSKWEMCEKS